MVISRTPLRVSFVGGGSDLPVFADAYGGAVVSAAIDKYVHVIVTERFESSIRVSYSTTEIVDRVEELQHELVREALRAAGIRRRVEIVTIADVPSRGSGLGSSSAVTIGLLNALFAYQGILKAPVALAEEAARIEIDVLGKPIGRQDQWASAYGGLQFLRFGVGGTVEREPVILSSEAATKLDRNLLMFWTGGTRSADPILEELQRASGDAAVAELVSRMRDVAVTLHRELGTGADPAVVGDRLRENWELKRALPGGVTNPEIDAWYDQALGAGATGGKLLGAGGAGFLLFYVPRPQQEAVRRALADLRELPFRFASRGSSIVLLDR
jgi:D-glycero-alpha-D-manno-heptose-7-phosphate kinase